MMNRETLIGILEKGFTAEWKKQSGRPNFEIIEIIQESFLIDEMVDSLNKDWEQSKDRILVKRYQRIVLIRLAGQFAFLLYLVSNEGKNVNNYTIREAQDILKNKGKCPIMPCIKPKN